MSAVPQHVGMSIAASAGIVSRASKSRECLLNGLRRLRREPPEGLGAVFSGHHLETIGSAHDLKTIKSAGRTPPNYSRRRCARWFTSSASAALSVAVGFHRRLAE